MARGPMPRIQAVAIPILKAALPGVDVGSWGKDVDIRTFPYINVRRLGGIDVDIKRLGEPVIELTAYTKDSYPETESLYLSAREALYDAVLKQTIVPGVGYLHSFFETLGPTEFESPFVDSWRVQGLIRLGLRPPKQ
jgi:hypothetical protein